MTAVTAALDTPKMDSAAVPALLAVPVKGSTHLYKGTLVAISAGYLVSAASTAGLIAVGRVAKDYDNSSGADGDLVAEVEQGVFRLANGDTIVQADVGKMAYMMDNATVAKGDLVGARGRAGRIVAVDDAGVWVQVGMSSHSPSARSVLAIPLIMANIANSDVVARYKPGFAGRIVKAEVMNTIAVTTGAKAATLTTKIATVACTGGVLALSGTYAKGSSTVCTDLTALNVFGPTDEITVEASAVTAFSEGEGVLLLTLAAA